MVQVHHGDDEDDELEQNDETDLIDLHYHEMDEIEFIFLNLQIFDDYQQVGLDEDDEVELEIIQHNEQGDNDEVEQHQLEVVLEVICMQMTEQDEGDEHESDIIVVLQRVQVDLE